MNVGDALVPEAVDANRGGRLTDDQRRAWRHRSRGFRRTELVVALWLVVIGLVIWLAPGPARYASVKPLVGGACLVIAAFLVWRALSGVDRITEDVRAGAVQSIEGAITKHSQTAASGGSSLTTYYFDVANQRFEVSGSWYQEAPDAAYVRVFYLPKSRRVANMEVLPGEPAPAFTPAAMQEMAQRTWAALRSHNEAQIAEARAQDAAIATTARQQMEAAAVPPPAEERDTRPLSEAIVGSWTSPFASLSFDAGGSVTATLMGGLRRSGHWSVDAQGHLVSDAMGHEDAAEAWIAGDALTIKSGDMGLTFTRDAAI